MLSVSNEGSLASAYLEVALRIAQERQARAFLDSAPRLSDLRGWYRVRSRKGVLVGLCAPDRGDVARKAKDASQCDLVPLADRYIPTYLRPTIADLLGIGSSADRAKWTRDAENYRGPKRRHPGLTLLQKDRTFSTWPRIG